MQVNTLDRLTRLLCKTPILPMRLRTVVARMIIGSEFECGEREFASPLCGKLYYGSIDSHIDWHVFFFGCYDPLGLNLLQQIASQLDQPVALDIGANAGNHMMLLSQVCRHVHCFEPYPKILPQLRRNIEENQIANVTLHEFGLSDHGGPAQYYENAQNNFGAGSFEASHNNVRPEPSFKLRLEKADDLFPRLGINHFDIVKIDVEGHEPAVLKGMKRSLINSRPLVYMEHGPTTHQHVESESAFHELFPTDYSFYRVTHRSRWSRTIPRLGNFRYDENSNMLAVPEEKRHACDQLWESR